MVALVFITSWAGVVSTVAAIAAAVSAVAAVIATRRNRDSIIEVHAIVNSRTTDLTKRVEQLSKALQESGAKIPQSPEPTPPN
jgi:hypothetical protein